MIHEKFLWTNALFDYGGVHVHADVIWFYYYSISITINFFFYWIKRKIIGKIFLVLTFIKGTFKYLFTTYKHLL